MKQAFFFFFLFYCDWNFTIIIICGWLLGWGLWGIGKRSSPQQAFTAAELPVVAGRVGHDQNDGVGQGLSTTLEPTKRSVYNLTAAYMWFSWDERRIVYQIVLLHMVTLLDFIVNKASVADVDFWLSAWEWKGLKYGNRAVLWAWRSHFSPHSHIICTFWVLLTLQSHPLLTGLCFL